MDKNEMSRPLNYYPDRVKVIIESLFPFYQGASKDIGKIIGRYEYRTSLDDIYNRVMNRLPILIEEREEYLKFHNKDFMIRLYYLVKKSLISFNEVFWYDLLRLLFKWTIYFKQSFKGEEFEKDVFFIINLVCGMINRETTLNLPFNCLISIFDRNVGNVSKIMKELINCELVEDSNTLHPFINLLIKDHQQQRKSIDQDGLKMEYFNRDVNDKLFLKAAINAHDSFSGMKLQSLSELKGSNNSDSLVDGKFNLVISEMRFENEFIIDFFLEENRQFSMETPQDLVILLRRLKEMNLLKGELIKKLVGFNIDSSNSLKWKNQFEKYLIEYMDSVFTFEDERYECLEYLAIYK